MWGDALLQVPFIVGLLLAWSLAAPPGPGNALIAQEATRRGLRAGVLTGLGAIAADLTMFVLAWLGATRVLTLFPWLQVALGSVGAAILLRFAWSAWRLARQPRTTAGLGDDTGRRGGFAATYVVIVASPFNWLWWASAGTALFADFGLAVVVGFFLGLLAWVVAWSALVRTGASRLEWFVDALSYGSAVVLAAFAAKIAWQTARVAMGLLA